MNKNICFFVGLPVTRRDFHRFGVEILKRHGFKVAFLDMTAVFYPEYIKKHKAEDRIITGDILICESRGDIEKYFIEHKEIFGINLVNIHSGTLFFYRLLKKHNIHYATICTKSRSIPEIHYVEKLSLLGKILLLLRRLRRTNRKAIYQRLLAFLSTLPNSAFFLGIPEPQFIIAGGEHYLGGIPWFGMSSKVIWAHVFDYDRYLERQIQKPGVLIEGAYAVFLDENYPFHPDFHFSFKGRMLKNPFEDFQKYYTKINKFFDFLENKTGVPIVVAAHPRSSGEELSKFFDGRKVFTGRTVDLVAGASYVVLHASTAVNFAVLYKKPMIFITLDALQGTFHGFSIRDLAGYFNKEAINIDREIKCDVKNELAFDKTAYERFSSYYIKRKGTPEKYFWDIFAETLDDYSKKAVADDTKTIS